MFVKILFDYGLIGPFIGSRFHTTTLETLHTFVYSTGLQIFE